MLLGNCPSEPPKRNPMILGGPPVHFYECSPIPNPQGQHCEIHAWFAFEEDCLGYERMVRWSLCDPKGPGLECRDVPADSPYTELAKTRCSRTRIVWADIADAGHHSDWPTGPIPPLPPMPGWPFRLER